MSTPVLGLIAGQRRPGDLGLGAEEPAEAAASASAALTAHFGSLVKGSMVDGEAGALALVLPDAGHLAVDQEDGGQPALGAVDAGPEGAGEEVVGLAGGGDDVLVEGGEEADGAGAACTRWRPSTSAASIHIGAPSTSTSATSSPRAAMCLPAWAGVMANQRA